MVRSGTWDWRRKKCYIPFFDSLQPNMQLTARPHRVMDSDHPRLSLEETYNDNCTHRSRKSSRNENDIKSLRSESKKRSLTNAIGVVRRFKHQFILLPGKSKVMISLTMVVLWQHIMFSLWDQLFYQTGLLGDQVTPTSSSTEMYFAVAINTYRRPDMLREAVQHYAETCGRETGVSQVFVIWAEQTSHIPSSDSFFDNHLRGQTVSNRSSVYVLKKEKDSLNSRFEPIPQLETDAVFMVDDDLRVACPSLRNAFQAWKAHPDSMVGYYPRLASPPRGESSSKQLVYHTWPVVFWKQSFNLVLTKASFLHSKYLELYTNDQLFPRAVKDHVDKHMNCEDIAMSMLVANYTKYQTGIPAHPIYVEGSVSDKGLMGGISTGSGHMTTRSDCLTQLTAIMDQQGWGSPLDYQVPLRPNSWIQHAPGFWWQYRPSNVFEWLAFANTFT